MLYAKIFQFGTGEFLRVNKQSLQSCVINSETGKIDITMSAPGLAVSDDGYYYLFEEKTYETALSGEDYIVEDQKDVDLTFSVNLNYDTVSSTASICTIASIAAFSASSAAF